MPHTDPPPTAPHKDPALIATEAVFSQSKIALGRMAERIMPWLVEVGNWIFAGLIAFILVVLGPLVTAGAVDRALTLATVAFALALPLDLAGLVLLRLVRDTARVGFPNDWIQDFRDAGFPIGDQLASPEALESLRKQRTNIVLLYCLGILVLSILLTLTGLVAALWHMAWWIGVVFLAMVLLSLGIVIAALVTLRPPESPEQRERNRRYWDEMMRRAQGQSTTNEPS